MAKKESLFAWVVCGIGALFYTYEYFLRISPSVMTQDLMTAFNMSAAALGNLAGFYYYAYTPMQLPVGVMMDRYGPRRLLGFAALTCALGAYLFAHNFLFVAQLGRFLIGLGSAFAFVGVLKLATIWLPPHRFALIAGLATSLGMIGGMTGDIMLARFVEAVGWRNTVYYSALAGVVMAAVIWLFIPFHKKEQAMSSSAMSYRQLFDELLSLVKSRQMWLVGTMGFVLYLPITVFAELWGVPYVERVYGLSNTEAAQTISLVFLGWAIGGPLLGWVSDHLRNRRLPIVLCSLISLVIILIILYVPSIVSHHLSIWIFVFGVFTSVQIIVFPIAREINLPNLAGTALAMTNMLVMVGGILFQPLIGLFLDMISGVSKATDMTASMSNFTEQDFQYALAILPIGIVVGIIMTFLIKETHARSVHSRETVHVNTKNLAAD